jgi:ribosomal protein S18 acetylase RimI-like enzyme
MKSLPNNWITHRCRLQLAGQEAVDSITRILAENRETLSLLFPEVSPELMAQELLEGQAIPPGGNPERLKAFLITGRENNTSLGFLSVYYGYPQEETLYVGDLFMDPLWQGQGLGQEAALSLEQVAAECGFREIRLAVGLKNWLALRFWVKLGYDRITKISGERAFAPEAFANLELWKRL